jgi:hypothetical protein
MAKQFILENASPSTRLLEKRRQMFEVQEALELQKQEFARKVCIGTAAVNICWWQRLKCRLLQCNSIHGNR